MIGIISLDKGHLGNDVIVIASILRGNLGRADVASSATLT